MNKYWLWLSLIANGKYQLIRNLIDEFKNPQNIWNENFTNYPIEEDSKLKLTSENLKYQAEKLYEYSSKNNIKIISYIDNNYPSNLKELSSPPPVLFYKGTLMPKDECAVAIVGSRYASDYGKNICKQIANSLSELNVTIVSGMAKGIDATAHSASLAQNTRTIAVLGNGVDIIYPYENRNLYSQIINNGCVLSEFYPTVKPIARHFPIRNRIISGLSLATIVIEAQEKSGSLITASFAAEQGREVFAVPGNINTRHSTGTNKLIKDGARIFTSVTDVIEELNLCIHHKLSAMTPVIDDIPPNLTPNQLKIYNTLSDTPIHIDIIGQKTNLSAIEIATEVTMLEIMGVISESSGKFFTKKGLIV